MLNGGKRRAWERSWRQGSFRKGAKKRRQSFPSASQSEYTNMMTYLGAPNPRQHTSQVSWKSVFEYSRATLHHKMSGYESLAENADEMVVGQIFAFSPFT